MDLIKSFFKEEEGLATLEIVLIVVILLGLIITFKGWILEFFDGIMQKINEQSDKLK